MSTSQVCRFCGTANAFDRDTCELCSSRLDDVPTLRIGESNRSFGFDANPDFTREGVSPTAVDYLKERFRPVSTISKGGMGKLFLVQEILSGRFVALKVMLERAANDVSLVQQFMREAVITARLQHPHIIPVHELGFLTEGQLYYTMRFVDGHTFDEVVHHVELEERLRILRSAASAVNHAHKEGLWHRDLKPHNILIGSLGDTYVIDWGLVSVQPGRSYQLVLPRIVAERHLIVMPDNLLDDTRNAVSTMTGTIVGTPAYMSPEQIMCEDEKMGSVSDVWAFGVMLFEAITGRHPIDDVLALTPNEILYRIMDDRIRSPKQFVSDIPDVLNDLCEKMLDTRPTHRMNTLNGFIEAITKFLRSRGQTIADFGTFSHLPKTDPRHIRTLSAPETLPNPNTYQHRLAKKVEILSELAQLGIFAGKRRKELWRALAQL